MTGSKTSELKWAIVYLEADDIEPECKIDKNQQDGWFNDNVTLSKVGYNIKVEGPNSYHTKMVYKEDGKYSVNYQLRRGGDGGYITAVKTVEFNIDKNAPTVDTITAGGYSLIQKAIDSVRRVFFKNSTTVFVTVSDNLSGVKKVEYQIVKDDCSLGDEWLTYTSTGISLDKSQNVVIYVRATDKSSLVTTVNTDGVVVYKDAEADTRSVDYTKSKFAAEQNNINVELKLNGNTIKEVRNGKTVLNKEQYSVSGDTLTLYGSYLNTLSATDEGKEFVFFVDYNPYQLSYEDGIDEGADAASTSFVVNVKKHTDDITGISDISKIYDGLAVVQPTFERNSTGQVTILYTGTTKGGIEYSSNVCPTDAGEYRATISIEADENYVSSTKTVDFAINQKVAEFGWAISNTEKVKWAPARDYVRFWSDGKNHNPTAQLTNAVDGQVRYISHPEWSHTSGGRYEATINPSEEDVYHIVGIDENGTAFRDYNYTLVGTKSQLSLVWSILVNNATSDDDEEPVMGATAPVVNTTVATPIADFAFPDSGNEENAVANQGGGQVVAEAEITEDALNQIDDSVTPLSAEDDVTVIDDEEVPEGVEDIQYHYHWWILLLVGACAIYSIGIVVYRKKRSNNTNKDEK